MNKTIYLLDEQNMGSKSAFYFSCDDKEMRGTFVYLKNGHAFVGWRSSRCRLESIFQSLGGPEKTMMSADNTGRMH